MPRAHREPSAGALGSLSLGLKAQLLAAGSWAVSAWGLALIPTDEGNPGGSLVAISSVELPASIGLDVNVALTVVRDGAGSFYEHVAPVATLSRALCGPLGGYVESYAVIPSDGSTPAWAVATGLGWTVAPWLVLDASTDVGLTDAAPSYLVQTGLTAALPTGH